MNDLPDVSRIVAANAALYPHRVAVKDLTRALTWSQWNDRTSRLANALIGIGLRRGDRVAVLAFNRVEWMEVYAATARAGLVAVPVNFRLAAPEVAWIVNDSGARAFIVEGAFTDRIDAARSELDVPARGFIRLGDANDYPLPGWHDYETLLAAASHRAPHVHAQPDEPWTLMYTSGTTGRPKGAMRSHASYAAFYLLNAVEFSLGRSDVGLLVMPMCHVNSVFYSFVFAWSGGVACIYNRPHFDAGHLLQTLVDERITWSSLVPTHCIMLLDLPAGVRATAERAALRKLMVSSAPARRETKLAIMDQFPRTELFEGYGSTEAGLVTLLRPEDQLDHAGSIGREIIGTQPLRLLDDNGHAVADGEVGELWSCTPTTFSGYWNQPERSAAAFRDGYCGVGDMARRDADGYYELVDRKHNMIISGGENVYPSEVEAAVAAHPDVRDVAVIGLPDERWGEAVTAVVVLRDGRPPDEAALLGSLRNRIAGFKRPRRLIFVAAEEMPRTATGKILHRVLRDRFSTATPQPSGESA
ncbi:MAG: class I adenylate-forming enzyme family protein [Planctomycetota bacterium]